MNVQPTTGYALRNERTRASTITLPRSYEACAAMWLTRKRKLANNTYLEQRGENFAIRLHSTNVVTFRPDGSIVLNSGGWRTSTTKERINTYQSILTIGQTKGIWYCYSGGNWKDKNRFADGMIIKPDGTLTGCDPTPAADSDKLGRQITRYVAAYLKALNAGQVPAPSAGDCWLCALVGEDQKSWGEANHDTSHLQSHLSEKYYVPSLLTRAMNRFPVPDAVRYYLSDVWAGTNNGAMWASFAHRSLSSSLRRYLREQFSLGN